MTQLNRPQKTGKDATFGNSAFNVRTNYKVRRVGGLPLILFANIRSFEFVTSFPFRFLLLFKYECAHLIIRHLNRTILPLLKNSYFLYIHNISMFEE